MIRGWMARLRDDKAAAAARALREHGEVTHFAELADDRRVDERIRRAVCPLGASLVTRESSPGRHQASSWREQDSYRLTQAVTRAR